MTEPESGSDVGSLTTKAERSEDGFVINGQKVFISNAHISDHVLVVCRTTQGASKHEGLTMIWVPRDADGMEIVPIETMGGRESNTLYFSDCIAPESAVLGQVDQGWTQLMSGLNVERLILAATMLGIAERASTTPSPTPRSASSSAARSAPSRRSSTASPILPPTSRRLA